jgi:hypothetical protein
MQARRQQIPSLVANNQAAEVCGFDKSAPHESRFLQTDHSKCKPVSHY